MNRIPSNTKGRPKWRRIHRVTVRVMKLGRGKKRRARVTVACSCSARGVFTSRLKNGELVIDMSVRRRGRVSRCPALVMIFRHHLPDVSRKRAERALDHGEGK